MKNVNGVVHAAAIPLHCGLNWSLENQDWKFVSFRSRRMRHPESPSQVALPEQERFCSTIALALRAPPTASSLDVGFLRDAGKTYFFRVPCSALYIYIYIRIYKCIYI